MRERLVDFKGWNCKLNISRYIDSDQIAICLSDFITGDHVAYVSECAESIAIPANHVLIRDHLECEGAANALSDAGIIQLTGKRHIIGYADVLEARLLLPSI